LIDVSQMPAQIGEFPRPVHGLGDAPFPQLAEGVPDVVGPDAWMLEDDPSAQLPRRHGLGQVPQDQPPGRAGLDPGVGQQRTGIREDDRA
jgi:hypothetical protein